VYVVVSCHHANYGIPKFKFWRVSPDDLGDFDQIGVKSPRTPRRAGYLEAMATTTAPASEYAAVTESCGLLDRSERGKLALTGTEAKSFLQGQVSNDVESLSPGTGCYAAFLTPKGKMLGDLRVLDTGDELLLDTERVALQPLFNMIRRAMIGFDVQLHKRTLERGLLSLIGPESATVAGAHELPDAEHAHIEVEVVGVPASAIRTDLGIDLLCSSELTEALRRGLLEAGAREISDATAECLRIERGRPRYGVELDDGVIPQEAGLNQRAVSWTKGCYVGQETVARLYYRGKPNRALRGLRLSAPVEPGAPLRIGEREVGRVGSTAVSPRLGAIALALVRREAEVGATVDAAPGVAAEVVALPFP
jgi:folate-binding protein YgfZ